MANTDNISNIIPQEALDQIKECKVLLDEATQSVERFAQESRNIEFKLTGGTQNFTQLNENITKASVNINNLDGSIQKLNVDLNNLTMAYEKAASSSSSFASSSARAATGAKDAGESFEFLGLSAGKLEMIFSRMLVRMTLMATVFEGLKEIGRAHV